MGTGQTFKNREIDFFERRRTLNYHAFVGVKFIRSCTIGRSLFNVVMFLAKIELVFFAEAGMMLCFEF